MTHPARTLTALCLALLLALSILGGCARDSAPDVPVAAPVAGEEPAPPPPAPPAPPAPPRPQPEPEPSPEAPHFDVLIRGALVIDGSGAPGRRGDVGMGGERIAAVGDLAAATADRVIDAAGLVLAPGFINPHSHTWEDGEPDARASLLQGITTEVGGPDGRSPWPIADYFAAIEAQGTGVNEALLVGHGTVRRLVLDWLSRPATPAEIAQMADLVEQAMQQGAVGLSTGLEYRPGTWGDTAELIALAQVAARYGGLYSTHMRSEGDAILEALDEALTVGAAADLPVNLSHLKVVWPRNWHKLGEVIARIDAARARGQQVFADVYPYTAPDYAANVTLASIYDRFAADRLIIKVAGDKNLVGKTLAEAAAALGFEPVVAAEHLLAFDPDIVVVAEAVQEDDIIRLLQQPWAVVGTDGEAAPRYSDPAQAARIHPRSHGTYPRILRWVRERQIMPLAEAIHKMSGAVADAFGFAERGYIRPGYYADIVVFDPTTVTDRATWWAPQQDPEGIEYVFVNGVLAVEAGQHLPGTRAGKALRAGAALP